MVIVLVRMRGTAENGTGTQHGLCLPKMGISVMRVSRYIYLFFCVVELTDSETMLQRRARKWELDKM